MKTLFLFTTILLLTTNLWCQNTTVIPNSKEFYLEKSKKQNKTGWFLLGGGVLLTTVGGIGFSENFGIFTSNSTADGYGFMMLAGIVSGLSSIPVFIGSANNARRAASLTFNANLFPKQNALVQNYQPVIGIKIEF